MAVKRRISKFFKWFFGIFLFLILLVFFGSGFFADRIGKAVISELNKSLKSDIQVESYDLTLVKHFPNAAVTLHNIKIPDDKNENALLEAKELAFRFKLFSLFGSNIKISSVVIDDGAMFIKRDKNGNFNYDIFKETGSSEESSELNLKLEEAKLKDIEMIYVDEKDKTDVKINIDNANMAGEFSGNRFDLKSDAEFQTVFFETTQGKYFANKNINYDADVIVDLKNEKYNIKNFLLSIEENKFNVNGAINKVANAFDYNLSFDGKDCTLQSLIGLLPDGFVEDLTGLNSKGDFTFEGTVKGKSSNRQPAININLGLKDGRIDGPQFPKPLKDVTFNATYTNGNARTTQSTVVELKDFRGYLDNEFLELKLKVADLTYPYVDLSFNGAIPFKTISEFVNNDIISGGEGNLMFNKLELHGKYDEMLNPSLIYRVKSNGSIDFEAAALNFNGEKIQVDKGKLILRNNDVELKDMTIDGVGSKLEINGSFNNLLPVLLSDSINSKDAKLIFDARIDADKISFEKIRGLSTLPEENSVEEEVYDSLKMEQYANREMFSNFLDGSFECNIGEFSYGKINGENFKGKLTIKNNEYIINGNVDAMEGSFDLDGIIYMEKEPMLKAKLVCNEINGTEFFRQSDNFGQDYLTDKNLKGKLDANIAINAYWSKEGDFLMDKLKVLTDMNLKDGELINFAMLESFSKFVKMKDLSHIRFTNTRNWMEIKKGVFYLPVMLIQNNALNLTISGEHSFDQEIDYNVKVNAGQVMIKKLFKKPGSKPIKAKNGWFNLYYKIKGTIEDYEMDNAKKQVKAEFERSERRKKRIKFELEKEFGNIEAITDINKLEDQEG